MLTHIARAVGQEVAGGIELAITHEELAGAARLRNRQRRSPPQRDRCVQSDGVALNLKTEPQLRSTFHFAGSMTSGLSGTAGNARPHWRHRKLSKSIRSRSAAW